MPYMQVEIKVSSTLYQDEEAMIEMADAIRVSIARWLEPVGVVDVVLLPFDESVSYVSSEILITVWAYSYTGPKQPREIKPLLDAVLRESIPDRGTVPEQWRALMLFNSMSDGVAVHTAD